MNGVGGERVTGHTWKFWRQKDKGALHSNLWTLLSWIFHILPEKPPKLTDFCSRSLGQQFTIWGSLETQTSSWPGKGKVTHSWDYSIFLITSDTLKKYWAWHTPDTGQGAGQPRRWFWPSTKLEGVQGSTKESEARAGFFKRSKNQLQMYFYTLEVAPWNEVV